VPQFVLHGAPRPPPGPLGGEGGFSAAVCSGAGGGDVTDSEGRVEEARVAVATGGGFATVELAAGGGTADFGLVRLRTTTTGFVSVLI
jgi:hypothetical protein